LTGGSGGNAGGVSSLSRCSTAGGKLPSGVGTAEVDGKAPAEFGPPGSSGDPGSAGTRGKPSGELSLVDTGTTGVTGGNAGVVSGTVSFCDVFGGSATSAGALGVPFISAGGPAKGADGCGGSVAGNSGVPLPGGGRDISDADEFNREVVFFSTLGIELAGPAGLSASSGVGGGPLRGRSDVLGGAAGMLDSSSFVGACTGRLGGVSGATGLKLIGGPDGLGSTLGSTLVLGAAGGPLGATLGGGAGTLAGIGAIVGGIAGVDRFGLLVGTPGTLGPLKFGTGIVGGPEGASVGGSAPIVGGSGNCPAGGAPYGGGAMTAPGGTFAFGLTPGFGAIPGFGGTFGLGSIPGLGIIPGFGMPGAPGTGTMGPAGPTPTADGMP